MTVTAKAKQIVAVLAINHNRSCKSAIKTDNSLKAAAATLAEQHDE